MAGRWRIRHKLMLGLGLVVGVMAFQLAGTVQGLTSYRRSSGLIESQLAELTCAQEFRLAVLELAEETRGPCGGEGSSSNSSERDLLRERLVGVERAFVRFRVTFEDSVNRGRYLTEPHWTHSMIPALEVRFGQFRADLDTYGREPQVVVGHPVPLLRQHPAIARSIDAFVTDASDLVSNIQDNLKQVGRHAKAESTRSLWILGTTSLLSIFLMAALLRSYYHWVFNPVRDLMQGVSRVAKGDFEYTIRVDSGDEMQDLAAAFNEMTERLREMYRDLERQVNERSRQLVRSERLASVGFLAAGVAHEINNPLASIAFCSEALEARLLSRDASPGQAEVIFKYLKMIQEEAFRCKEITQRLLEFSRSSERRREPTDLAELVQSVLDVTQHLQNHKGKAIVFDPSIHVTAWVNAPEVKSVVLNLVVNALESMEDQGRLTVTLRQREGRAELRFQDSGCGMSEAVLENIFEPFYTQSRTGKGTGLGLTISHRIVTAHGGEIEAASPGPGLGSTFTVRLPLLPPAESAGKDAEESASPEELFRRRQAA